MTIPVYPGPFQFLAEGGQALGEYGQVKEERKRHGEEIAHRAIQQLMADIKSGKRPASVLRDPEIKKLYSKAYGVVIPDLLLPQPQETLQTLTEEELKGVKPGTARSRAVTGVAGEDVAKAGESQQIVKGKKAEAEMSRGVPEAEADTERVRAEAEARGLTFNKQIYEIATGMLGTDPNFKRLAAEAATGVLDGRIRMLMYRRESLSLERQRLADDAKVLTDMLKESAKQYENAIRVWETNKGLSGDEEAYEAAHPKPTAEQVTKDYLKTYGFTPEEFQTRLKAAMQGVFEPDTSGTRQATPAPTPGAQPGAQPPPQASEPPDRIQATSTRLARAEPKDAAEALAELVDTDDISDLEARAIMVRLKESAPGSWFKTFNRIYSGSRLKGKKTSNE
jgi:hypothetical protein